MFDDVEALVDLAAEVFANEGTGTGRWFCLVKIGGSVFAGPKPATKVFQTEGPSGIRKVVVPGLNRSSEASPSNSLKPFRPPPFESEGAAGARCGHLPAQDGEQARNPSLRDPTREPNPTTLPTHPRQLERRGFGLGDEHDAECRRDPR